MPSVSGRLTTLPVRRGFVTYIRTHRAAFRGAAGNIRARRMRPTPPSVLVLTHEGSCSLLSRIITN